MDRIIRADVNVAEFLLALVRQLLDILCFFPFLLVPRVEGSEWPLAIAAGLLQTHRGGTLCDTQARAHKLTFTYL